MTIYCNGEECDIICGSYEEGWAAIRFDGESEDSHRDVPLTMLSADGGGGEIDPSIREANGAFEADLDRRLQVNIRRTEVTVRSGSSRFWQTDLYAGDYADLIDLEEAAMTALEVVDMAHRQPGRFLYKRHRGDME